MIRRETLRQLLQTGEKLTVTKDQQGSEPLTFPVLSGTSFRVLRAPHLDVLRGESLTFISFAVESDWVLCMNASYRQGFVPLSCLERNPLPTQPSVARGRSNDAPQPSVVRGRPNNPLSSVEKGRPNDARPSVGRGRPNYVQPSLGRDRPNNAQPSVGRVWPNNAVSGMSHQQQHRPSHNSLSVSRSYDDDYHSMAIAAAIPSNFEDHSRDDASSSTSSSEGGEFLLVTTRQRGNADAELLEAQEGHIIHVIKVNLIGMVFGQCIQTSERGFIQRSYLSAVTSLDLKPWYVGKCSRDEAVRMLQSAPVNGTIFLVRESEKESCNVIGIRAIDTIRHRKINSTEGKFYAFKGHNFDTLENLVQYHMTETDDTSIGKPYNKFPPGAKCPGPANVAPPVPSRNISAGEGPVPRQEVYDKHAYKARPVYGTSPQFKVPPKLNTKPVDQSRELKMWFIDENKIRSGHILGTGHYGEVRLATLTDSGLKVAMKTFKCDEMDVEDFKNEAVAMKDLRHPYLVKLFGMSAMDNTSQIPFIIMEYHKLGSLEKYYKMHGGTPLQDTQKAIIAKHVANGMQYLSSQDYIHRDLAARNVLLASDLTPRIADFGLAKCMQSSHTTVLDNRMPWKWSAPEVIGNNKQWTTKCDVWSYGVLLWELYTNCRTPYETISMKLDLLEYLEEGKRLKIPEGIRVPGIIAKVMKECWTMRVEQRTSFSRIQTDLQITDITVY